jgi:alkylation response protein AidB-like acyl-CoA dehydrogenase
MADEGELDLLRSTVRGLFGGAPSLGSLAELGLLGLLVAEDLGGAGWSPVEAAAVATEVGRASAGGGADRVGGEATGLPWIEASIAAFAISSADPAILADWLPGALDASRVVTVASGWDGSFDGGRATGAATGVVGRPAAVVVCHEGRAILVPAGDQVVVSADPTSIDTTLPAVRWTLEQAPVIELGSDAAPRLHTVHRVLASAALVGILREARERLVPYLSDRKAFGSSIASFQAVQHRLVDLFLLDVRAGVSVDAAARALAGAPAGAGHLAAVAHAFCAEHIPAAIDECIQLAGGIGFTWEYPLHHELRRAVALAAVAGGPRSSRAQFLAAGVA